MHGATIKVKEQWRICVDPMNATRIPIEVLPVWARRDMQGTTGDRVIVFNPLALEMDI